VTPAIQVLVVDDAVVIRSVLKSRLSEDAAIEVYDVAANGVIALRKIEAKMPDLVVLDMEMPELDGIGTLKEIRKTWPKLPVVLFSGASEFETIAAVEGLALGAAAAIPKPSNFAKAGEEDLVRDRLIPTIKAVCLGASFTSADSKKTDTRARPSVAKRAPASAPPSGPRPKSEAIEIVAIGSSTGGPNALAEVLEALPADLPVPVVVVQHMPPVFTKHLADRLDKSCALHVREGYDGAVLEVGDVWIAPGDYHMVLEKNGKQVTLRTNKGPQESSCRPAVDPMMRSVAEIYGASTLAVILTGMGSDGLKGCQDIYKTGGRILVQDEETSVVWGMPGYVSQAGIASGELPLAQVGPSIARWCRRMPRHLENAAPAAALEAPTPTQAEADPPDTPSQEAEGRKVLVVDDSRAIRALLCRTMRELGFDPIEADGGVQALKHIADGLNPELALLDWNMPEMDGLELLENLRELPETKDLKIVMVTSETGMDFIQKALKAGADEYVMKPFSKEDLVARLIQIGVLEG
jgi:two-component system chemotaxis response regulator CheB